jgi:hypothetical protein
MTTKKKVIRAVRGFPRECVDRRRMARENNILIPLVIILAWFGFAVTAPYADAIEQQFPRVDADLAVSESYIAELRAFLAVNSGEDQSRDAVKKRLAQMLKADVSLRERFNLPFNNKYSDDETHYYLKRFDLQLQRLDSINTAELKHLLNLHGWFIISVWGRDADQAAWLVAQHSDQDVPFQKRVLDTLERLPARETDPANYALLFDRVAVHEGRPQRYGTQGKCVGPGRWQPQAIDAPAGIDERRKSMGLESLEEYRSTSGRGCH